MSPETIPDDSIIASPTIRNKNPIVKMSEGVKKHRALKIPTTSADELQKQELIRNASEV